MAITVTIDNLVLNLVCVYGPNKDDISFYHHLSDFLSTRTGIPSIIGGDWNTTYSTDNSKNNIDIYNMSRPPSIIRSGWLAEVCASHGLIDPYRAVYPVTKDYTYTPHGTKKNRSRLDFFLISNDILNHVKKCSISDSPSIMLFDHKSISLDFTKDKVFSKLYINRTILSNPRTDDVVLAAFADTYLVHAIPDRSALGQLEQHVHGLDPVRVLDDQKQVVGNFIKLLKEHNDLFERQALDKTNGLLDLLIAEKNTEISVQRDKIWDVDRYSVLSLSCEDDFFLEALASNIKGHVISFQAWVKRVENKEKNLIISRLKLLIPCPKASLGKFSIFLIWDP